ncbi:MAG TPA: stage 0 sporulation family protein [Pseudogracilibacillus sp.]|nr:stage 0 sporulation family protein [Pseudogracilibacillus sp.]
MIKVIGVRFKEAGKIYYFDPNGFQIETQDYVIVETAKGVEFARAVISNREVEEDDVVLPLKKVQRMATEKDVQHKEENLQLAKTALHSCKDKIIQHKLDMNLVDVEYSFDRNKAVFYFTAEGRVDFRNLVKDLASDFKTRIELRQIGVRDEAKLLGGIGPCGRMLCCSTFLGDFEPVSIKMAKDQNLSLNPAKISGICGRLMCCLKYENDHYEDAKKNLPDMWEKVETDYGHGKVVGMNILEKIVQIEIFEKETVIEYTIDELIEENIIAAPVTE